MEKYIEQLKEKGLKITHQRLAILKYLDQNREHPTADQIYTDLKADNPSLSKTTVYNTLEALVENGIVCGLTITPNEQRFDIKGGQHHHFICKVCGVITDLDVPCSYLKKVYKENRIEEVHGYFKGTCKNCIETMNETPEGQ